MTIHFLPNTSALIKVTDIFTRNSMKQGQKNQRIKKIDLVDFLNFNFSGIPDLNIKDAMHLIQQLQTCFAKCSIPVDRIKHIKNNFISPPSMMSKVSEGPEILKVSAGSLVAQVVTCTDPLNYSETLLPSLPTTKQFSVSNIDWEASVAQPIKVKEILNNYLFQMEVQNLILAQKQDPWISKLETGKNKLYFTYEDIVMTKKRLGNGLWVSQILMPEALAYDLITQYHKRLYIKHESVLKMKRHLDTLFHIRNYNKIAQKVVNDCTFCAFNKSYPNPKLSQGVRIMVNAPRQFIAIDICTVRSDSEVDSFLTILDVFSKLVLYIPINKDCTASVIVQNIFQYWVRYFNFPIAICTDGGKNVCNAMMGDIASMMNTKLVRISPANSQANMSERYNLLCIQTLRIFAQNYHIDDENFSLILSLAGQMINQSIQLNGHSAYYLHYGTNPRQNTFLTYQSIKSLQAMDEHVQNLAKCQNVCFVLAQKMQQTIDKQDTATQLPSKYRIGDFVLLRQIKIQGPRHGIKLKKMFHEEPFRIVRRYKTNVLLVPYNRRFLKNRLKGEGKVTKNMAILARISRLKPIQNPLRMLQLTVSEKILKSFCDALKMKDHPVEALEIIPNPSLIQANSIVRAGNPSLQFMPENMKSQQGIPPLKVQQVPSSVDCIQDIYAVRYRTILPGHTNTKLDCSSVSSTAVSIEASNTIDKLIPRKKHVDVHLTDTCDSGSVCSYKIELMENPFNSEDSLHETSSFYSVPDPIIMGQGEAQSNGSPTDRINVSITDMDINNTPVREDVQSELVSSKAKLSTKKKVKSSVKSSVTTINLPSGKSLKLSINPKSDTIRTLKK